MTNKFLRCFPSGDGMMLCEHHNGNWIAFPITEEKHGENENRPQSIKPIDEDDFQAEE